MKRPARNPRATGWGAERSARGASVGRCGVHDAGCAWEAAEINDSVLQQMAATKWLLESGRIDEAIELLEATMTTGQQLVTRVLGSNSVLGVIRDGASRTS